MSRRPMMVANWKMHKTAAEAGEFFLRLQALAALPRADCRIAVAPSFLSIPAAVEAARGLGIGIAGQNLYWEAEGAFTGEVSAPMLAAAGCSLAIIGHSERRGLFGETDYGVRRKVAAALEAGLAPIVCVGETERQRAAGEVESVLRRQIEGAFLGLGAAAAAPCILAYEPIWAIGTGKTASPAQAQEAHAFLRACAQRLWGSEPAHALTILYGGSIKPDNAADLLAQPDIDGGLVGGASLLPDSFAALLPASV